MTEKPEGETTVLVRPEDYEILDRLAQERGLTPGAMLAKIVEEAYARLYGENGTRTAERPLG